MRKRLWFGSSAVLFVVLVSLLVWQGSFTFGAFGPSTAREIYLFWALSTVMFILTVSLGFMLFRTAIKLYIERQVNRPGSRIKMKLIGGALALSFLPVLFLVIFSVGVLNRNLETWFSRPARNMNMNLIQVATILDHEMGEKLRAQGQWLSVMPQASADVYQKFCAANEIEHAEILATDGEPRILCSLPKLHDGELYTATAQTARGSIRLSARMPVNLAAKQAEIEGWINEYNDLGVHKKEVRRQYLLLLSSIALFILFFAMWLARYMATQISTPLTALANAAEQVRRGNLGYRVKVAAIDEMATLVKAFNEMTEALETSSRELEARRRFTEAILESIPTGVISLTADGGIQRVNRALMNIFSEEQVTKAEHLSDLFSPEDIDGIRYVMNRARRTGVAGMQMEYKAERHLLQLSLTVAAVDERRSSGFVLVVEDTSELLRAQKTAAWHEVARRVAHEIKNPLTPIALCADRIVLHLDRPPSANTDRILRECATTIAREVESVRQLVDEFSQFTRFPAAQPVLADLNEIVLNALAVFEGRLDQVEVEEDLMPGLPLVNIDCEQFKRVIVNLVDNAAEAMQSSLVKRLLISTRLTDADSVELIVADTGAGVTREDKEKLFLPYFSTKGRGTGLGLAIVARILIDHEASIRVEDNLPSGARFIMSLPVPTGEVEISSSAAEIRV
jgi:two-component system, NtrC family, nitrogen regulation sensor histidine kinase NtrY